MRVQNIHTYIQTCTCTCTCTCVHTYVHACIHTYIHTYIYIYLNMIMFYSVVAGAKGSVEQLWIVSVHINGWQRQWFKFWGSYHWLDLAKTSVVTCHGKCIQKGSDWICQEGDLSFTGEISNFGTPVQLHVQDAHQSALPLMRGILDPHQAIPR